MKPSDVSANTVGKAVRELQRAGLAYGGVSADGLVSMGMIPAIAERLGFRKKTVRALRAEQEEVCRKRDEEHIAGSLIAGRQYGWISLDAAAFILRGQGRSSDPGYAEE